MFAKCCDIRNGGCRRGGKAEWRVERPECASRIMDFGKGSAMRELWICHRFPDCAIGRRRHAVAVEEGLDFLSGALFRPGFELVDQFAPIDPPIMVERKTGIGDPLRMAGGNCQVLERSLAGDG